MYKVAIQGIKGSFHQEAASLFFKDDDISYLECLTFPEVVKNVRGSDADYGVIAIENALIGTILTNYRLIENHGLNVVGEVYLPIHLNLLALPGQTKEELKEIWSHPLAIAQSENYLDEHNWEVVKKFDTARCAKEVYQNGIRGVGVLASPLAARYYKMNTLDTHVQNENDTYTRFYIVSTPNNSVDKPNKAVLSFKIDNQAGSLVVLLSDISQLGVNISKIFSVPYTHLQDIFQIFLDIEFENLETFEALMAKLKDQVKDLKLFGMMRT